MIGSIRDTELTRAMDVPQDVNQWPSFIKSVEQYVSERDINLSTANVAKYFFGTALEIAIERSCEPFVRFLVNRGVDIQYPDYHHPLLQACEREDCSEVIIQILIEHGANVNCNDISVNCKPPSVRDMIRTDLHGTALSRALLNKKITAVKLLLQYGADFTHPLVKAAIISLCCGGFLEVLKPVIEAGFPVNDVCYYLEDIELMRIKRMHRMTPLQASIRRKGTDAVPRLLLEHGADPNGVGFVSKGNPRDILPPLVLAVEARRLDLVSLLLSYGADVNITKPNTISPLMGVAQWVQKMAEHYGRTRASLSMNPELMDKALRSTDEAMDYFELMRLHSSAVGEEFSLAMTDKLLTLIGDTPVFDRYIRLDRWVRRRGFLCVLHAAGLLDLTGKMKRKRDELSAGAMSAAYKKRSRTEMVTAESELFPSLSIDINIMKTGCSSDVNVTSLGCSSQRHRSSPELEKVMLNLHREIAAYL